MTRRMAAKVDGNQAAIVETLRAMGCVVQHLHMVGQGVPDLVVGAHGVLAWVEVKDGERAKLTEPEAAWHRTWQEYPVFVVRNDEDVKRMVDVMRRWGG